ncbi:NUDIX hydrolase [uncultured Alistipes sp.]|uniref:NUDIX hydrolase n=1 Tax=uncultured Alistipes sp. TaxID=538949 RepID=UPI0025F11F38|nr:NUDIX hydrolase [uncultured Alistipes sp.]
MCDHPDLREVPLSETPMFEGVLIDVSHMQVRLPNGQTALREVVHHKGAAAVVPVDAEGNVYLVRQHRVVVDLMTLEIPAGKLDYVGEDPLSCAHRELEEETGLRAGKMEKLMQVVTTPGFCTEQIGLYLATELSQHVDHPDPDEFLHVEKLPLAEAVRRVMAGELRDAKTALGLLMAWEKLRG